MTGKRMIGSIGLACLLMAAAGCVPQEKYDDLYAAWSRTSEELTAANAECQRLKDEIATVRNGQAASDKKIADLNALNTELNAALKVLDEKYRKALEGRTPPGMGSVGIIPAPVHAALKALADGSPELMDYLPTYGMLKLKADLTFDKGSAVVKPEATKALTKLAEIVNTLEAKPFHVYIAGHTDDIPLKKAETIRQHGSNWGLSCHRALAVVKALFAAGVEQKRMGGAGFSMYHPVAPNAPGNKGNPLNRRVEIWIVPPDRFLTVSGRE